MLMSCRKQAWQQTGSIQWSDLSFSNYLTDTFIELGKEVTYPAVSHLNIFDGRRIILVSLEESYFSDTI